MKNFLSGIIAFVLINLFSQAVYAFPDVSSDSPYYAAIQYFEDKGIIEGYTDGTFRPNQEANRAEALKIILLGSNIEVETLLLEQDLFPDISMDDWFYPYIKKGKDLEIIEGYPDGTFKPEQTQNIAETLKLVLLTNDVSVEPVQESTSVFPDVTGELWFAPYALYAKEKNIIEPQNDGKMNAGRGITRGELVELMYRMDIVKQNGGTPFDISTNWPVIQYPQYAFQTKKPFTWQIIENEDEVVLWRPDEINHQSSYEIPFPYSGSITIHLDENEDGLDPTAYESNLDDVYKSDFGSYQKNSLTIDGYKTLEYNAGPVHDDFFIFFPENKVLQLYTTYGWSDLTEQLVKEIEGILDNIGYITQTTQISGDILSEVRNHILVEGMGQEMLNLFSDLINIETDTIGVGTGPIDYFYSERYKVTIKYERESDTILDIMEGRTSAF